MFFCSYTHSADSLDNFNFSSFSKKSYIYAISFKLKRSSYLCTKPAAVIIECVSALKAHNIFKSLSKYVKSQCAAQKPVRANKNIKKFNN